MVNQAFNVFQGGGGNGKRAENTLLIRTFGGYHGTLSKNSLTNANKDSTKADPNVFNLFAKRSIPCSETAPGEKFGVEPIKKFSGGDPIPVRTLHSSEIKFPLLNHINCSTNEMMVTDKPNDGGVKRRLVVFRYIMTFVDDIEDTIGMENCKLGDPELMEELSTTVFAQNFMAMLLQRFKDKLSRMGRLQPSGLFQK